MCWDVLTARDLGGKWISWDLLSSTGLRRESWDEKQLRASAVEAPNPRLLLRSLAHTSYQPNLSPTGNFPRYPSQSHSAVEPLARDSAR